MNGFELAILAAVAFALAILLLPVLAWLRLRALERGTLELQNLLSVYLESSVRVANAVSHLEAAAGANDPLPNQSSRRALVQQARYELDAGKSSSQFAGRLGLRRDELKLIEAARESIVAA